MGHDISGFNKRGIEVAYARYGMSNPGARILYKVLNAEDYDGGVSGIGIEKKFNENQIVEAIAKCLTINWDEVSEGDYEKEKIEGFLKDCLNTATEEGEVKIFFG
ncbi:hypothetical protein NDS46_29925 (plasmid) [Paenibacillus thiaminolyticus]|uniref:hypothetical protein n=1 Tax=Paenibacillus thiaminolyticus TaxID=49283 RepID=UPI00232ABE45|nr:hypothetical protein [Paenibacillus thiaminolyticus]WCF11567.1 hypothetical protein NDS46_29925 [Paenibacillus thiaminolyticus]